LTLSDLLLISGFDHRGTIHGRHMPNATVFKTGTLRDVSSLAGVIPTRDRGLVWFAILNRGNNVSGFRAGQDQFLQHLVQKLQVAPTLPTAITPHSAINTVPELGSVTRNEILYGG
jgi:serine-type D-Ala-D-Ala carboxypeptidase/endopeptidase (penicillin-binding protein 4)